MQVHLNGILELNMSRFKGQSENSVIGQLSRSMDASGHAHYPVTCELVDCVCACCEFYAGK